jgi:hypothetical protein
MVGYHGSMTHIIEFRSPETPHVIKTVLRDAVRRSAIGLDRLDVSHRFPEIVVYMDCRFAESPRNYAGVIVGVPVTKMVICEALAEQPIQRVRGILYHEMGHILKDACHVLPSTLLRARADGRELDGEQQTDAVAEEVLGVDIYYDDDLVQQAGPGARGTRPRPFGLR